MGMSAAAPATAPSMAGGIPSTVVYDADGVRINFDFKKIPGAPRTSRMLSLVLHAQFGRRTARLLMLSLWPMVALL